MKQFLKYHNFGPPLEFIEAWVDQCAHPTSCYVRGCIRRLLEVLPSSRLSNTTCHVALLHFIPNRSRKDLNVTNIVFFVVV